jgi:hypothetical protein
MPSRLELDVSLQTAHPKVIPLDTPAIKFALVLRQLRKPATVAKPPVASAAPVVAPAVINKRERSVDTVDQETGSDCADVHDDADDPDGDDAGPPSKIGKFAGAGGEDESPPGFDDVSLPGFKPLTVCLCC